MSVPAFVRDALDAPGWISDLQVRTLGSLMSDFRPAQDVPDLTGKVALVTGGNSGIGFHTVQQLALKGCRVYMGCRSETRGHAALDRMQTEGGIGKGSVELLKLDLSTPKLARAGAEAFLSEAERLDILVCNAGVLQDTYKTVSEGGLTISHSMSTNHLGHFVLVQQLIPVMAQTASMTHDVRIVNVSAEWHWIAPLFVNFRTLEGWNYRSDWIIARFQRYGLSKLANILFIAELQRRLRGNPSTRQITAIAVQPGHVASEGFIRTILTHAPFLAAFWLWLLSYFAVTPLEGSYTTLFAATSIKVRSRPDKYGGGYLYPYDRVGRPSFYGRSRKLAEDLWQASEEIAATCLKPTKE